jgi:hypothetical protein
MRKVQYDARQLRELLTAIGVARAAQARDEMRKQ